MKAIETLMEKRGKFDYILLETTGLADPGVYVLCNNYQVPACLHDCHWVYQNLFEMWREGRCMICVCIIS